MTPFKNKYTFTERSSKADKIMKQYPDRVPLICERYGSEVPLLDKRKYLVPMDLTVGQFLYVLRTRLVLPPEKAIFLSIGNELPCTSRLIGSVYRDHKSSDGFLYVGYCGENTFG
jgi:GABA(A) receptor-associated protein